jgi:hypothetical protein
MAHMMVVIADFLRDVRLVLIHKASGTRECKSRANSKSLIPNGVLER